MDPLVFEDVANSFAKLRMYPYFDISHYILMSIAVKEDTPQSGSGNFSRRHPFACWLATMLMCFGGAILSNFICGSPLFVCFDDKRAVLTATAVWYLINYCPFDLIYRLVKLLPLRLLICSLKEIQRARKIYLGVHHGLHHFPNSVVMCILLGLLKGCGSVAIRPASQFVLGSWEPMKNPFLSISFTTKISLLAALAYYVQVLDMIPLPDNQLFLAIAALFVYLRVTMILLGLKDPFSPFENITCTVFFGGTVDAIRNAFERSRAARLAARANATTSVPSSGSFSTSPTTTTTSPSVGGGTTTVHGTTTAVPSPSPGSPNGQSGLRDPGTRQTSDKKRD